ncbi:MAG: 2Fe-2S iron-sulfur cluster-binding protein, partial [Desulfobacteraceae bacterium]
MEEVSLFIDGKPVQAEAGTTVWEAARRSGIRIPTLCHHPDLKPAGACRICLVEDESSGRMLASCVTPVAKDMIISTDSEAVLRHRRNIVRLLMANHPESCVVCDQGNACRLREIA